MLSKHDQGIPAIPELFMKHHALRQPQAHLRMTAMAVQLKYCSIEREDVLYFQSSSFLVQLDHAARNLRQ